MKCAVITCFALVIAVSAQKPKPAPSPTEDSVVFIQPTLPPTPYSGENEPQEVFGYLCFFFPRWCRRWRRPSPPPPTPRPTPSPTPSPTPKPTPLLAPAPYTHAFRHAIETGKISLGDSGAGVGKALLTIMKDEGNVQKSNYNWRSFSIKNIGDKRIAAIFLDVTNAIFQDVVFDDDGSGGDDVAKTLSSDWGTTETNPIPIDTYTWKWLPARSDPSYSPSAAFDPSQLGDVNNLFVDELSDSGAGCNGGFRGELILFEDFDAGEFYDFSGDMDPNALAGLKQGTSNLHAEWDVGGVSGAEMINSVVTILFGDGSTASGTIATDGSQAGAVSLIFDGLKSAPDLDVDGRTAGSDGSFDSDPTSVIVSSSPGDIVRVSMVSAFDPFNNFEVVLAGGLTAEEVVTARLEAQYPSFPVTNAASWQHVDATIPNSGSIDLGSSFSYTNDFAIGFTAVVIDADGVPTSKTTDPIRLVAV